MENGQKGRSLSHTVATVSIVARVRARAHARSTLDAVQTVAAVAAHSVWPATGPVAAAGGAARLGQTPPDTQVLDARTIATMPAFTAGGRSGHCSITLCRSTSRAVAAVSCAAPGAAQLSECAGFLGVLRVVSGIIIRCGSAVKLRLWTIR